MTRGIARVLARAGRRGPFRRHLLRVRFGPWARRWLGGRTVVSWRGVNVEVDPGEAHGFHVFVHGDYGGAELDACILLTRHAAVFVDAGAHIGLMSLATARACPDVQVIAVEADPDVAAWFRRNLSLNPDLAPRIQLVEAAAADRDGDISFTQSGGTDNIGLGHVATEPGRTRTVPAVALGPFLRARGLAAEVVKMDVEGGELAALAGLWAGGHLPTAILLETHAYLSSEPDAFNQQLITALTERGYDIERLHRGAWTRVTDAASLGSRSHLRAVREPV